MDITSDKSKREDIRWSADDILRYYPHLGIPHFQRGLVWNRQAIALLLESLYLGTPCGALIMWQPKDPLREGIRLPGVGQVKRLIIDGQQRIRSIHMALCEGEAEGGEIEEAEEDYGNGRVWCLNLARIPELSVYDDEIRKHLRDQERFSLFRFIQRPGSPRARFNHNVIPLELFFGDREEEIKNLLQAGDHTEDLLGIIAEIGLKEKVKRLRTKKLFSVYVFKEDGPKYGLADVVSLYNRINSGGRRVESEEVAFASLVALTPGTGDWLKDIFAEIHPEKNRDVLNEMTMRDEVLRRRKERNFGFKLIIRTFIQVCAYHFGYSVSNAVSFDLVDNLRFRNDLAKASDKVGFLHETTGKIIAFVRKTLSETLHCDDLQMLPDTTALLPVFQILIRFPGLMETAGGQSVIGYIILRLLLLRRFNQQTALDLADLVNKSHKVSDSISNLEKKLGPEIDIRDLQRGLNESNALQDRYTLLLYWLIRKNNAKDFLYEFLDENHRKAMLDRYGSDYEQEVIISDRVNPEKQHIVPYNLLTTLYEIKARGRISRHIANNIGNITYISQAENSFETGLGDMRARLEQEPRDNLRNHFLFDSSKSGILRLFLTAAETGRKKKRKKKAFERFCKIRRDLIAQEFSGWIKEMRSYPVLDEGIEPTRRQLNQQDEDHVRAMGYPDPLRNTLVRCTATGSMRYNAKKSAKCEEKVFIIYERNRRIGFEVWLCDDPQRIEVLPNKKPLYQQMNQWLIDAGHSVLERPVLANGRVTGRWVLSTDTERSLGTVQVFQKLERFLAERVSVSYDSYSSSVPFRGDFN